MFLWFMRASCVFPSGGLVFQPNESPAQKSYIMINSLGVGRANYDNTKKARDILVRILYLFWLFPFDILTTAGDEM